MTRWTRWMLIVLIGMLLVGCGGGRVNREARAAAEQFTEALAQGDLDAAKAMFGTPWDIRGFMTNRIRSHGEPQSATVESLTTGETTAQLVTVWELERATVQNVWSMSKQADGWRITQPSMNPDDMVITPK